MSVHSHEEITVSVQSSVGRLYWDHDTVCPTVFGAVVAIVAGVAVGVSSAEVVVGVLRRGLHRWRAVSGSNKHVKEFLLLTQSKNMLL